MKKLLILTCTAAMALAANAAENVAYWTGSGSRSNVNDPANWIITNSLGVVIANAVPDAETAVIIRGETDFNCPYGQMLVYESITVEDCKLTADCDWRGLVLQPSPTYIDVPNGAYVDTGFKPNQDTRVVMDVTVQGTVEYWCGAWDINWNDRTFAFCNDDSGVYTAFVKTGNANNGTNGAVVPNGRHVLDFDKGVFKVDGTTHTSRSADGETYQWIYPLYLFAQNRKGAPIAGNNQGTIRFHACQIYDNGEIVRDYVPTNNGTVFGLYDKVNGTFSASANDLVAFDGKRMDMEIKGTVELAGHSLMLAGTTGSGKITDTSGYIDVPKGYYLNTGFKPNQDTRVVMDVTVQGTVEYWCGAWDINWNDRTFAFCNDDSGVYTAFVKTGNANNGTTGAVVPNGRHVLDFDKGVFKVDGTTHTSRSADGETYQWIYPLYLFAQNRKGSPTAGDNQGTIRFHACQIYDAGTLAHDYIPAKIGTAFCLYDKVNSTFVSFSGSGAGSIGGVVAGGKLHIDTCGLVENTTLTLDGSLTLVKEGAGIFRAAKAGQSYTGGTIVSNGLAQSGVGATPWGLTKSLVTVSDGGAFDWAGVSSQASTPYSFAIEGTGPDGQGALLNTSVSSASVEGSDFWKQNIIADLELLGDATIRCYAAFGFSLNETYATGSYKHSLVLNSHTLSICINSHNGADYKQMFAFRGVKAVNEGTIVLNNESTTKTTFPSFYSASSDLSGVTFDLGEGLGANFEEPPKFGTFIDRRTDIGFDEHTDKPVVVLSTFKPMTTNLIRKVTLGDTTHLSPTLDLSALNAPFVLPASGASLSAAEGAKVCIDVGERGISGRKPLISWAAPPDGVSFSWTNGSSSRKGRLVVKPDGLYVNSGLIIIVR